MDASFIISICPVCGIVGTIFSGVISDKLFGGCRNVPALIFGLMNVLATRIIGLAKGEMIFDGTPQQLNNAVIEKIYNTSMENLIIKQGENYA